MLLKIAKRELQKWLFNRKEALSHPVIVGSGGVWPACDSFYCQWRPYRRRCAGRSRLTAPYAIGAWGLTGMYPRLNGSSTFIAVRLLRLISFCARLATMFAPWLFENDKEGDHVHTDGSDRRRAPNA